MIIDWMRLDGYMRRSFLEGGKVGGKVALSAKLWGIHLIYLGQWRWMRLNVSECLSHVFRIRRGYWILAFSPLLPFSSLSMFLSFGLSVCLSFFLSLFFHLSIHFAFIFILLSQKGSQYKSCTDPDWYVACQQNPIAIPINDNIDNNDSNSGSFKCFWLPSPSSRL